MVTVLSDKEHSRQNVSFKFFFFFFSIPFIILALYSRSPSQYGSSSDPGSHNGPFSSPLPTTARTCLNVIFTASTTQHFLPFLVDSRRIVVPISTLLLGVLSSSSS